MAAKHNTASIPRRTFLAAAAGAAATTAAALALPAGASSPAPRPGGWRDLLPPLRAAYLLEIEQLAEALRPRFESGELRGNREDDYPERIGPGDELDTPHDRLEAICGEHFGTETRRVGDYEFEGDAEAASVILALSPSREETGDEWAHPTLHATLAESHDVLRVARERGMYVPFADESGPPLDGAPAEGEARS